MRSAFSMETSCPMGCRVDAVPVDPHTLHPRLALVQPLSARKYHWSKPRSRPRSQATCAPILPPLSKELPHAGGNLHVTPWRYVSGLDLP